MARSYEKRFRRLCLIRPSERGYTRSVISRFTRRVGTERLQLIIEEKIAAIAAEERRVWLLMMMTGVGYFTAMLVLTDVGDAARFRGEKAFASWLGLTPIVQ